MTKRMTVSLPPETTKMLEILSELRGSTYNQIIKQAISTESFLQTERNKGSEILIKTKDGNWKEIVFR